MLSPNKYPETISNQELEALIALIRNVHGFDFGHYSRASLKRRVLKIMAVDHLNLFDLRMMLTNNPQFFEQFLIDITVNVTEMFRDPEFYKSVRQHVAPYLSSYQKIRVWNAGCSTGEELYSFAILFHEEQLYERSFFYGTDINSEVIEHAKSGIYDLQKMKVYSENYLLSGASHSLSEYYTARYGAAALKRELKKNALFSIHNLASDGIFNEFQLISCRNVLIYFDIELQIKVIELFYNSLATFGFLCLGSKETLRSSALSANFRIVDRKQNIYQKIS
ncbi:chemotaxis protein CheR [Pedobacter yulinensis]|uniref:Chemotaxis protein CheR n=1 Tax=Pedobacter yulinensis TaxID=2126353 RepID=A0A2T3HQD6_9SPHI|nr:protein-glutamate O-methyltransferase CheR [Pedobacter yulinensis]PST84597.1 chemotaxis protein CheR [Pedobacter yulinensis]